MSNWAFAQPVGDFRVQSSYSSNGTDTLFVKSKIIVRNASKDTIEISGFKNGKKDGVQKLLYNNGEIRVIAHYKNGLLNGKVESYNQGNKQAVKIENYLALPKENRSVLHGLSQTFQNDGSLYESTQYKNGRKNGPYSIYHTNGKLREKSEYKDDLLMGRKMTYNNQGDALSDENFIIIDNPNYIKPSLIKNPELEPIKQIHQPEKLSVLDGKVKYYHGNGLIYQDLNFRKGKKEGLCKEYQQNGNLLSEVVFKDGFEHGAYAYYRADGNLERKGIYYKEITVSNQIYKNVYDGEILNFQANGKRHSVEHWKNFKRNGVFEKYYYNTGELSQRYTMLDDLKTGTEERFDKDGTKSYEAHFEIKEVDGKRVSLQQRTETYWEKGKLKSTAQWVDGFMEGAHQTYYKNGQVEKIMYFKKGEFNGISQTFYPNGQLKEDYTQQKYAANGTNEFVGWNTIYDEKGQIQKEFFGNGNGRNTVKFVYENTTLSKLSVNTVLQIEFENQQINSIQWLDGNSYRFMGFTLFGNQKLRRIYFKTDDPAAITANFTSDGKLNQLINNTGKIIEDKKTEEIALQISKQIPTNLNQLNLKKREDLDGIHQMTYTDGSPFFSIQFKDKLPQGKWMVYNPIKKDTLFYAEFDKGQAVGKWIKKNIDGSTDYRKSFYPNHKIKEEYRYQADGKLSNLRKLDESGNQDLSIEYHPNGQIKNWRNPSRSSYMNIDEKGDTLSYNMLYTDSDSIRIERQFFAGNKLKVDRFNNFSTNSGYVKTYFENGQLQTSQELRRNKKEGVYQQFNENGKLVKTGHYKNDKQDGKWISYDKNGKESITQFKEGEIVLEPLSEENNDCKCYDTTLPKSKIGFANQLSYLADYNSIKAYLPKNVIPIDDWFYEKIFYINFNSNNDRNGGFTQMKLLPLNSFAFYYPAENYLKIDLLPCTTEGYLNNFGGSFSYNFGSKKIVYADLSPKRISISLMNNPLKNANDQQAFSAYYDTRSINFNENGISNIYYEDEDNTCYPKGIIKDFLAIEIKKANPIILPRSVISSSLLPIMENELNRFYGFEILDADYKFNYTENNSTISIQGTNVYTLAGANYVGAEILIKGKKKDENSFTIDESSKTIHLDVFKKFLEEKGFYRVKVEIKEAGLHVQFYTEN